MCRRIHPSTSMRVFWVALLLPLVSGDTVSIPLSAGSAPSLSPNLVSLSIEQDRWPDWVGTTTRNSFFFNTLNNLVGKTGASPTIRIGADSEDHTNFNPNVQFVQQSFPPPTTTVPYPEANNIVAGPGFYEAAQFLPSGTGVTWGVNFGGKNLTATFLETQAIINAFASSALKSAGITLDFLELGNEADLYSNNGLRPSTYSVSQYTTEWISFATNLTTAAKLSSSNTRLWGGAFAGSSHSTTGFSPQGIFANNILSSTPGKFITTISQHHYSGSFCTGQNGLLQDLMTKSSIRSNLNAFVPDIKASKAQGLDYVLGETNSYSCHGAPGVSNTAGAALWTLDYALFASQIGISRVFFHEGIGYKYNLIQPEVLTRSIIDGSALSKPLQPHVQPQYYAAIIIADAIGKSGSTKAVELTISDTRISGYAFYEGGALKRAVFINSLAFLAGQTGRTSTHIDFTFTGTGTAPTGFTVKRLAINHADDTSGLTWGGQSYETSTALVSGTATSETGTVSVGLDIPATQAVLLSFTTGTVTAPPPPSGAHTISPGASSKVCLAAPVNASGGTVVIQPCSSGAASQSWTQVGNTISIYGNMCLDVTKGSTANGTKMQIWSCTPGQGDANQQFTVTADKRIEWTNKGECLDLTKGDLTSGNPIQMWKCATNDNNQVWNIV